MDLFCSVHWRVVLAIDEVITEYFLLVILEPRSLSIMDEKNIDLILAMFILL